MTEPLLLFDSSKRCEQDQGPKPNGLVIPCKNLKGWLADLCSLTPELPDIENKDIVEIGVEVTVPRDNQDKKADYQEMLLSFITRDQRWYELPKQSLIPGTQLLRFKVPDPTKLKSFKKLSIILNSDRKWATDLYITRIMAWLDQPNPHILRLWPFANPGDTCGFQGEVRQTHAYASHGKGSLELNLENHSGWNENICIATRLPDALKNTQGHLCFDCFAQPDNKRKPSDYLLLHLLLLSEEFEALEIDKIPLEPGWNYHCIPLSTVASDFQISSIKFAVNSSFKMSSRLYLTNFRWEPG